MNTLAHYKLLKEIFDKDLAKGVYAKGTIFAGIVVNFYTVNI